MLVVACLVIDCWCVSVEILASEGGMRTELDWVSSFVSTCITVSRTIVCLFVVDVVMHIVSFGPKHYFGNKLYVLDFFVVITTVVLEFIVHPLVHTNSQRGGHHRSLSAPPSGANHDEATAEAASAIVALLRSWRFVRLVHGLAFSEKLRHDEHLKLAKEVEEERLKELELESTGASLSLENQKLRARIKEVRQASGGRASTCCRKLCSSLKLVVAYTTPSQLEGEA